MIVQSFTGGAFAENGYLLLSADGASAAVVDPGACAPAIVAALRDSGARLEAILLTHAHLDHVEGIPRILDEAQAPIFLHPADRPLWDAAPQQAQAFGMPVPELPDAPDRELAPGDTFELGGHVLQVRFAPGHAPGHVIFWEETEGVALVGDVVFQGSVGRTDLPGGDYRLLFRSIREQVLTLPDETRLLTGHGPETTVGHERVGNPFLTAHYGGSFA